MANRRDSGQVVADITPPFPLALHTNSVPQPAMEAQFVARA